ncbi:hypothetical protein HGB25_02495 [Candidatus Saccharibacteria bacterium]|nr:hypothetical protein [Candidatus Saccharibacteria bacterium]
MAGYSTLFYSWQSDNSKTRSYVEKALKQALENITSTMNLQDAPRLDRDTQGEVGAVSITATIKQKINSSTIFLADVSLVNKSELGEKLSNQNVMFELGYAFGKKSENAVMLVANSDLGSANELPFDIAQNRVIFFSPRSDPKAQKFIANLEGAITAHLGIIQESKIAIEQEDAKERLIKAIEEQKPTLTKAETFFEGIFAKYLELGPEPSKVGELYTKLGERTYEAYQKTLPLTVEFFELVYVAAEYGDMQTIKTAYRMIGLITARYDQHSADEYAALIIQELASLIIGCLAKHERWSEIGQIISLTFAKPKGAIRKYKIENTYQYPEGIKQFYNQKTGSNYAIPTTPMLQERFIDNDRILQAYVGGSLLLMLALDFYYSYATGLLLGRDETYIPEYISRLSSKKFAIDFSNALGVNSLDALRKRIEEKRQQPLADGLAYWNRDLTHIFNDESLMPIAEKVGEK